MKTPPMLTVTELSKFTSNGGDKMIAVSLFGSAADNMLPKRFKHFLLASSLPAQGLVKAYGEASRAGNVLVVECDFDTRYSLNGTPYLVVQDLQSFRPAKWLDPLPV